MATATTTPQPFNAKVVFNNVKREATWEIEKSFNDEQHLENFINRVVRNKNHTLKEVVRAKATRKKPTAKN
jgi:hypothetical protein